MLLSPGEWKSVPHHVVPEMLPNRLTCPPFSSVYYKPLPNVSFHHNRLFSWTERWGVAMLSRDPIPMLEINFAFEIILDPFKLNLNT